jgi:glucokinase
MMIAVFAFSVNHAIYVILQPMSVYIAIDIGGTHLRAATYPPNSFTPIEVTRIFTQSINATPLQRLIGLIEDIWPVNDPVLGIGVAVPGPTDPFQGIVLECPNIPGWENLELKRILEERFNVPVVLGNDANLAALAEWRYGAGQGHHHLLYFTVSTGIGSGVIIDNRLLLGARGLAAELGHVTIMENGPRCGCGGCGHLESVASGTGIIHWVEEQLTNGAVSSLANEKPITGSMISRAAIAGDELAIAALARSGKYMGIALANYLHIFNPTAVVIGGGVSQSGDYLLKPLHESLHKHILHPSYLDNLVIITAIFGDEAGLVGALALVEANFPE